MLTGPSGSGKTSWGRLLAQAILCPERKGTRSLFALFIMPAFASGNHARVFLP
jgi:ABC-type glutathione transport system ATPase component